MKLIEKLPSVETVSHTGKIRKRAQGQFYCPICKSYVVRDIYNGKKIVSCGSKDCIPSKSFRHGYAGTQVYRSWAGMRQRCDNPNNNAYKFYGAKGISYPEKWKTFEGFIEDMGDCLDPKMSIDRIDDTKSYSKENCQWLLNTNNISKDKFKPIIKLDLEGNELIRYSSAKEAAEKENIPFPAAITRVARGERSQYKGYIWKYIA